LILFGLQILSNQKLFSCQGSGSPPRGDFRRLPADDALHFRQGHRLPGNYPFFDKATRLIAGPWKSLAMEACYFYSTCVIANFKLRNILSAKKLSGDGGI
jgi:hypothetical protein